MDDDDDDDEEEEEEQEEDFGYITDKVGSWIGAYCSLFGQYGGTSLCRFFAASAYSPKRRSCFVDVEYPDILHGDPHVILYPEGTHSRPFPTKQKWV